MESHAQGVLRIFTVGHSNRSSGDFLSLLREYGIRAVADVRRYPSSRKFPHFNQSVLCRVLETQGIRYQWFEVLGGRRHGAGDGGSPNLGIRSLGFRNYADHMTKGEFYEGVQELLSLGARQATAVMCAEKFYWKCHRWLLSDFLVSQGAEVAHILEPGTLRLHRLTAGAVIRSDRRVVYP